MIANALSAMLPTRRAATKAPGPDDDFWYYPIGTGPTDSGITVTPGNALGVSAVYGCIRVLRESLGQLPWRVYRSTGPREKEQARNHYLWDVLHDRPNGWQSPQDFKDMGVNHLCLRGNFYSEIVGDQERTELWPLNPDRMSVEQADNRRLQYKYRLTDGTMRIYREEQLLHIRGLSLNGVTGVGPVEFARNTIGASLAQEGHGASLFKNGGLQSMWISRPAERRWTKTARENFRAEWKAVHAGAENAGQPPILGDGMELHELGLSNQDSQWIEARGFGAEEVCRFFGVPPSMLGVKSGVPKGSTEQQSLEFVLYTLGPLAVRFEQAANRDLLMAEDDDHYTKIILDALLRADIKSRYEAHNVSVQGGWGLINEVREMEDRNPIEGGDEPRFPMNMQPVGGGPDEREQGGQPGKGVPKQEPPEPPEQAAVEVVELTAYEQWTIKADAARPAFEILLREAAGRIAHHELTHLRTRADKARDDRVRWDDWANGFYGGPHAGYIRTTIEPLTAAWHQQTGGDNGLDSVVECMTADTDELFNPDRDPADVLAAWDDTRAEGLTADLYNLFFGCEP